MDYVREIANLFISEIQKHKKRADESGTQIGQIQGEYVIANCRQYSYTPIADIFLEDGKFVAVNCDNNSMTAVILGNG